MKFTFAIVALAAFAAAAPIPNTSYDTNLPAQPAPQVAPRPDYSGRSSCDRPKGLISGLLHGVDSLLGGVVGGVVGTVKGVVKTVGDVTKKVPIVKDVVHPVLSPVLNGVGNAL
ncbi:hypothetical protein HGRIS_005180 [Hohenbuehelia grisea]|uniref:Uncharacterized protein n=1 Tax=Hohenbuehelia grisea TaxID=104357 RepID=A0ABR3JFU4_9AGAR